MVIFERMEIFLLQKFLLEESIISDQLILLMDKLDDLEYRYQNCIFVYLMFIVDIKLLLKEENILYFKQLILFEYYSKFIFEDKIFRFFGEIIEFFDVMEVFIIFVYDFGNFYNNMIFFV